MKGIEANKLMKTRFCLLLIFIVVLLLLTGGCSGGGTGEKGEIAGTGETGEKGEIAKTGETGGKGQNLLVNKEGKTICERYPTPEGYVRVKLEDGSFGEFLRNQKLRPYGTNALFYDGREKSRAGIYDSVFDVDIGDRDLHQCADAIMLLRAEYLYSMEAYDQISFHFVSGFKAEYQKWMDGYCIKVEGNEVSYYKTGEALNTYESFRKFMDMVFAYSGTLSLEKELEAVQIDDMQVGDVFIVGGSPGHAVIVVDMAENDRGEKLFMIAQSYMPAQQTQLLINPEQEDISPWYLLKGSEKLITPQWTFEPGTLKRF